MRIGPLRYDGARHDVDVARDARFDNPVGRLYVKVDGAVVLRNDLEEEKETPC